MSTFRPTRVAEDDPLPRRRLLDALRGVDGGQGPVLLGARIKERPEDFLVEELSLYEPTGEGEHVYLGVQKIGMAHSEMVEILARHYRVPEEAIGFAGMKDKVAVTRQTVSIQLPGKIDPPAFPAHERIGVLWTRRHANKLRRGHLLGNRFAIRVRGIDPLAAPAIYRALRTLEREGVPAYYGVQRFGYRRNTHRLGRLVVNGDAEGLLSELLGARGSEFPEHQRRQRELYDEGRWSESLSLWSRNDRAERFALRALVAGRSHADAVAAIPRHMRIFWVSALQSSIFNRLLDRRIDDGLFDRIIEGDVAYRHDNRRQFLVTAEVLAEPDFEERVRRLELSPSGPMLAPGMVAPGEPVATWEREALDRSGVTEAALLAAVHDSDGTRRPFRVQVRNIELLAGFDEHGPYVRLAFDLPRGAYATVLLRELFGEDLPAGEGDSDRDG